MKVNAAFCAMLGYSAAELLARDFQSITHPDDLAADLNAVMRLVAGAVSTYRMEKRYVHRDGRIIWGQLNVSLVRDALGRPLHFVSQVMDVTDLREAEERLRVLAVVDELTGLLNRRGFRQEAERQLAVARRAT